MMNPIQITYDKDIDKNYFLQPLDKKWVSVESLKKWLEEKQFNGLIQYEELINDLETKR